MSRGRPGFRQLTEQQIVDTLHLRSAAAARVLNSSRGTVNRRRKELRLSRSVPTCIDCKASLHKCAGRGSRCKSCHKAWKKHLWQTDPIYRKQKQDAQRVRITHHFEKHPERKEYRHVRKYLGMSPEAYQQMLVKQGAVCAICGNPPKKIKLSIDHDHATGLSARVAMPKVQSTSVFCGG